MIRHHGMIGATALLLAASLHGPAGAASGDVTTLFGKNPGKGTAFACFTRTYDAAHLASHPKQNVTGMTVFAKSPNEGDDGGYYTVSIGVHFRASPKVFQAEGGCSESEDGTNALNCGIDCEGGTIDVAVKDANAILVSIPDGARTWDPVSDMTPPEDAKFGVDDKLFRVDRAPVQECLPLVFDEDIKAQITHTQ